MSEADVLTLAMGVILLLHLLAMCLFTFVSVVSMGLVIGKPLGREFESAALVWIRALRKIRKELKEPHEAITDE